MRDYRFYSDNMTHPSSLAQEYIWERFGETYFSERTANINNEWHKIRQSINHKPYNKYSDSYKIFLYRTINDIQAFEEKYPFFSCFHEKQFLTQLFNNTQ